MHNMTFRQSNSLSKVIEMLIKRVNNVRDVYMLSKRHIHNKANYGRPSFQGVTGYRKSLDGITYNSNLQEELLPSRNNYIKSGEFPNRFFFNHPQNVENHKRKFVDMHKLPLFNDNYRIPIVLHFGVPNNINHSLMVNGVNRRFKVFRGGSYSSDNPLSNISGDSLVFIQSKISSYFSFSSSSWDIYNNNTSGLLSKTFNVGDFCLTDVLEYRDEANQNNCNNLFLSNFFSFPYDYIMHIVEPLNNNDIDKLKLCYKICLDTAYDRKLKTVFFPPLGSCSNDIYNDYVLINCAVQGVYEWFLDANLSSSINENVKKIHEKVLKKSQTFTATKSKFDFKKLAAFERIGFFTTSDNRLKLFNDIIPYYFH